jgi:PAS domain S-box-containing protein
MMASNSASTNHGETGERPRRFSNELVNGIVDAIPHMIWVKDADELRFVLFNRAGEDLLGVARDQLLGKSDYDIFPREQAEVLVAKDRDVLATGGGDDAREAEILSTPKGVRILQSRRNVILGAGRPRYIVGIAQDITASRERDREELLRRLEDAQKIEAIGLIAGKVAHDLSNLLAVILMAAQELATAAGSDASAREDAEEIIAATHRAAELTRQLRALSRR